MKDPQSTDSKVVSRINGHGRGWVFTPTHFKDLGNQSGVALALMRHAKAGNIRQLARGLYDYPRKHPKLGLLTPSVDAVARALSGRDAIRLQPAGGYAANLLGLSDQVPMKIVFLTDGPSRQVPIGKQMVTLKKTTPKNMATAGKISGLVIQALRHLGERNVDFSVIEKLRGRLTDDEKKMLRQDLKHAPAWMAPSLRRIAETGSTHGHIS